MLAEKLEDYYGLGDGEAKAYIAAHIGGYEAADEERLFSFITETRPKKYGFPDITALLKAFATVKPSRTPQKYFWRVCAECDAEYAYNLPVCPACWRNGLECRFSAVRVSTEKPPLKVIRYNKQSTTHFDGKPPCYDCQSVDFSYCQNFGNPKWECRDMRDCHCVQCCMEVRRYESQRVKSNTKVSYAVPRKTS